MVTEWMPADLSRIIRTQQLTDQHVQSFVYQMVRALKVFLTTESIVCTSLKQCVLVFQPL